MSFRLDLLARLSTFELDILPLWRRPEDILPILKSMEGGEELFKHIKIDPNLLHVREMIPLNVRSLQQMVKRYKVLGELPE
jgi:DNA-binding NtrC family response regulator